MPFEGSRAGDPAELRGIYREQGFVALPGFLSSDELAELRHAKERLLTELLPDLPAELVYFEDKDDPSSLKQVQRLFEHDPYFEGMMFRSRFERLAADLLGEQPVGRNLQYFNKPAGHSRPTPPHQDGYYFMLEPCRALTMWLALEDVGPDQGSVHYVRGSHQHGLRKHASSGVLGFSQHIEDFGTERDLANDVPCPCAAGDLLVHDALTIHWAGENATPSKSRESMGLIYYGASARVDEERHARYQAQLAEGLAAKGRI